MIRVCIADDHRLIRSGVRAALAEAVFEVVAEASSGDQVVAMVDEHEPDVVLMDLRMPGADSIGCVRAIRQRHPEIRVVMLSASEDPDDIAAALEAGPAPTWASGSRRPTSVLRCARSSRARSRTAPAASMPTAPTRSASPSASARCSAL